MKVADITGFVRPGSHADLRFDNFWSNTEAVPPKTPIAHWSAIFGAYPRIGIDLGDDPARVLAQIRQWHQATGVWLLEHGDTTGEKTTLLGVVKHPADTEVTITGVQWEERPIGGQT